MAITGIEFLKPLISLWDSFVLLVPGLIAGIILAIVGYLVSYIIGHAIKLVLIKTAIDKKIEQAKISKAVGYVKISSLLGELVKWYIFIIFLQSAVDLLNLGTISDILGRFVLWVPNLIAALLIVIFGLLLAQFIKVKLEEHARTPLVKTVSNILLITITAITVIIALDQIGIEVDLLENLVLLVIGSLAIGSALALGLSFGLGNKKEANEMLRDLRKRL